MRNELNDGEKQARKKSNTGRTGNSNNNNNNYNNDTVVWQCYF